MSNKINFNTIQETNKVKDSQYLIINRERDELEEKIQIRTFIQDLGIITTSTLPPSSFISVSYSEAQTLIAANDLEVGSHYLIEDKADLGIILLATSTNTFSLEGQGIFLNPDYQNVFTNNVGVWHSAIAGLVANTSIVIWKGLQYLSLTGLAGLAPDIVGLNWSLISKTANPEEYIKEVDYIHYDFNSDAITLRQDLRNNSWCPNLITTFQAGNNLVTDMTILGAGDINIYNQRGTITGCLITSGGKLTASNDFTGVFSNNKIFKNFIVIKDTISVSNCTINSSIPNITNITFENAVTFDSKTIDHLSSTFNAELDMTSDFAAGSLTIPSQLNYVGIYTLENASGSNISNILNLATGFRTRFYVEAGNTQNFVHLPIAGSANNDLVSDAGVTNTITGRTNGSDFIEYERAGNLNRRYNAVILA